MPNLIVILILPLIGIYNLSIQAAMSSHLKKMKLSPETGIIKGAESIFLKGKKSKAVLMIHGYIGSPTDYGRLPEMLHQKGYSVSVPLLPGHGRDPREFSKVTSQELINYVDQEYEKLKNTHDEVIVVGFSMGGALATLLANRRPIKRLVLLAPYYQIAHQWYYMFPAETYSNAFTPYVPYVYRPKMFKQINDRTSIDKIIDYDFISTRGSQAVIELGKEAVKSASNIKARTLMIQSKKDKATDYKTSKKIAAELKGLEKLVSLENSNHMILWDYDVKQVEDEIIKFITSEVE